MTMSGEHVAPSILTSWHPELFQALSHFQRITSPKLLDPRTDSFAGAWALKGDQLSSAPPRRGREVVRLLALGPPSPVQLVPAARHAQSTNCSLPGTTAWQRRPVEALWMKASSWVLQLADTFLQFIKRVQTGSGSHSKFDLYWTGWIVGFKHG